MGPAANEPRGEVVKLGQFNLQLTLGAARTLSEDVQDQGNAVYGSASELLLQITFLSARECVVEDDNSAAILLRSARISSTFPRPANSAALGGRACR